MNIEHTGKGNKGIFFLAEHGEALARMVYKIENDKVMLIEHTVVMEEFQGEGIGEGLVKEAVNFARKNLMKIKATCSFAKSVLQNKAEYSDVYVD